MSGRELLNAFGPDSGPLRRLASEDLEILSREAPEESSESAGVLARVTPAGAENGRRRHPRVENAREVQLWRVTEGSIEGPVSAKTVDVSAGGMRFRIRGRWRGGETQLVMAHELAQGPLFGDVIRVARGWRGTEISVRFVAMPEDVQRSVRREAPHLYTWAA